MKFFILIISLLMMGVGISKANHTDDAQFIDDMIKCLKNITTEDKEQFENRCEKQAVDIYENLMLDKDLYESQLLEKTGLIDDEMSYDAYTYVILFRMYEDVNQLPRRTAMMKRFRARLNKTERGRRIAMLLDKEIAVRRSMRRGDKNEAFLLNNQLINDYNDFAQWDSATSPDRPTFQALLSIRAEFRDIFLRSERGEAQVKKMYLVEMTDNPYRAGKIGMLQCGGMPSLKSPVFINTIGERIRDTMSLDEMYKLLEQNLGKSAIPYIFAIKVYANCVTEEDEEQLRRYVQMSQNSDGTYADVEAAYILATYLWGNNSDNPQGVASEFEKWKEGYMIIMKMAYWNDERACMFVMSNSSLRNALPCLMSSDEVSLTNHLSE